MLLNELSKDERVLLLKFVCAFAWADLEVQEQERAFVKKLIERLGLSEDETALAAHWLSHGVPPEEVDPNQIPRRHREIFLECAREVIAADGETDPNEAENYALFQTLLA